MISLPLSCTIFLVILTTFTTNIYAKPYRFMVSSKPICNQVSVAQGTHLKITYEAPDLREDVDMSRFDKELIQSHMEDTRLRDPPTEMEKMEGGYDGAANDVLFQKQRQARVQKMMKEMSEQHVDMKLVLYRQLEGQRKPSPIETWPLSLKGEVLHTADEDGKLEICTQSIMATRNNPRRIYLQIDVANSGEGFSSSSVDVSSEDGEVEVQKRAPDQTMISKHLLHMERMIQRINRDISQILREADYTKRKEVEFHNKSLEMNAAARWWPICQLLVLIGTGVAQANYMVQFFKRRHFL